MGYSPPTDWIGCCPGYALTSSALMGYWCPAGWMSGWAGWPWYDFSGTGIGACSGGVRSYGGAAGRFDISDGGVEYVPFPVFIGLIGLGLG